MPNPSPAEPDAHPPPIWTIIKLIDWSAAYFTDHGIDSPRMTAEILLAHVLGYRRIDLYLKYDQPLTLDELAQYKVLVKRRLAREPVAYILGTKPFWTHDVIVSPDVLIPRPESEGLVEAALKLLPGDDDGRPQRVLETGVGSGAVIIALASERPQHRFFASDISTAALAVARKNRDHIIAPKTLHLFAGDWFGALKPDTACFDLILSNPPYVPSGEFAGLQDEVAAYEPRIALDGGRQGVDCIETLIHRAPVFLSDRGSLLLEIGYGQKEAVTAIADHARAYETIQFSQDHSQIDRIALLRKKRLS
jgi:release factor glutamine methyltransferase